MTLEEIDKIIVKLQQQIPVLQTQLHQALGYKQALIDLKEEKEKPKTKSNEKNT